MITLVKISSGLNEMGAGTKFEVKLVTLILMGSAHLTEANIRPKFNEILSWGRGDMKRAKNPCLLKTLTLSRHG